MAGGDRSAELAHWFPAAVAIDGRRLRFGMASEPDGTEVPSTGEVLVDDSPRRFAFTWDGDELTFELEPLGPDATLLRFSHGVGDPSLGAMVSAGWHVCLDILARHLAGEATTAPGPEPTPEWRTRYDQYVARGVPAGAPIPTGAGG